MKHIAIFLIVLFLMLLLASVALVAADITPALPYASPVVADAPGVIPAATLPVVKNVSYTIRPEDVLQVDVWGEPTLQRLQLQVTPDGSINVAYVGDMKVAGLTPQQIADEIGIRLKEQRILKKPKVQVTIITVHRLQVNVLGQVNRPGPTQIKDDGTIIEAIAAAGSYTAEAYLEGATITRRGSDVQEALDLKAIIVKGDLSKNIVIREGDTIYIPENITNKYYVMGEVLRPQQYQLKDNTRILDAINMAGGPTPRGSIKGAVLIHNENGVAKRDSVDIRKMIDKGDMSQNREIKPGDIVFVPETNKPDWNKISQVLSAIMNVSYLRRTGLF